MSKSKKLLQILFVTETYTMRPKNLTVLESISEYLPEEAAYFLCTSFNRGQPILVVKAEASPMWK